MGITILTAYATAGTTVGLLHYKLSRERELENPKTLAPQSEKGLDDNGKSEETIE